MLIEVDKEKLTELVRFYLDGWLYEYSEPSGDDYLECSFCDCERIKTSERDSRKVKHEADCLLFIAKEIGKLCGLKAITESEWPSVDSF